jgi:uncharacterized protein (TIGR02001 family)
VGIQSDYRYRGISLSGRRPVATFDLAYDHPSGFYAGGSVVGQSEDGGVNTLGFIEYAGFVTRRFGRVAWDVGVNNQNLSYYYERRIPLNYSEVYVGVIGDHLSAHLHYSPNYIRPGNDTLYAEIDGSMKPAQDWRLFAHVGTTAPVGSGPANRRQRYDVRAGVARQFSRLELQASVTGTTPAPPAATPPERGALILGASWFF